MKLQKPWFLFTARLDAGAHVRLHLGYSGGFSCQKSFSPHILSEFLDGLLYSISAFKDTVLF